MEKLLLSPASCPNGIPLVWGCREWEEGGAGRALSSRLGLLEAGSKFREPVPVQDSRHGAMDGLLLLESGNRPLSEEKPVFFEHMC